MNKADDREHAATFISLRRDQLVRAIRVYRSIIIYCHLLSVGDFISHFGVYYKLYND